MLTIGCHLSSSKGFLAMGREAVELGANTFQFFSRNPRGGSVKPLDEEDINAYLIFAEENKLQPILAHAPYTYNPASSDKRLREFAKQAMIEDLSRLEHIPGSLYNLHPGSHVKQGPSRGIELTSELLNHVLRPDSSVTVLLETMAGKGSEIGRTFEELQMLLDGLTDSSLMGVCLDTCHVLDAGYDLVSCLDEVLDEFDRILGLGRLKAIHLNDSLNPPGSHKDRHAKIGEGFVGIEAFERIINHPSLRDLSFYLETPNDLAGYAGEIALLKSLYHE